MKSPILLQTPGLSGFSLELNYLTKNELCWMPMPDISAYVSWLIHDWNQFCAVQSFQVDGNRYANRRLPNLKFDSATQLKCHLLSALFEAFQEQPILQTPFCPQLSLLMCWQHQDVQEYYLHSLDIYLSALTQV